MGIWILDSGSWILGVESPETFANGPTQPNANEDNQTQPFLKISGKVVCPDLTKDDKT